jgi:thiol:disulfide interchange protein DsbA
MHKEGNMLQTEKRVKDFLSKFNVAPELTDNYLRSFTINQKISRDAKHAKQLLLTSTPMIVVDGKYVIQNRGSFADMLKVADYLIELQRPNS